MNKQLIVFPKSLYVAECWKNFDDVTGKRLPKPVLRWKDDFWNIVVTAGLNKLLDATIKSGLASPAWYVGLKGTGSMISADTMGSHSGWSDIAPYSNGTRPAYTPGSISSGSVDNSASKAVFNINATSTVYGCFLCDNSTVSGTTGTLYGGGDFGSSRAVINGDTLNITITLTQVTG
jgi:hypothetical protein